ncbi:phage tail fiber protein [Pukyongiella litopenaei]|uniref:Uncharacterized protein n=1 Tax=Pukyongiella litopenaei TaxID=2605946 RepID=A0A2S0MNE0_9RHOB|nr:hypothetical protein [Pukyongiella litopenaei]AVO37395.1 hypothetical protein C6Y53_06510 [Pukyongiella litopenaei]
MSAKSNYAETLALTFLLTTDPVTRPTAWYVALHTGAPGEDGTNAELAGNGYTRQAATFSVTGDAATNDAQILFGPATASWGSVSHFSVWDANSAGNCLYQGALDETKSYGINDEVKFPPAALVINEA